jgi:hypothetical protein
VPPRLIRCSEEPPDTGSCGETKIEGLARYFTLASFARQQGQEVIAEPELLNPAHALVNGKKSKGTARAFARAATWLVKIEPHRHRLTLRRTDVEPHFCGIATVSLRVRVDVREF